MFSGAVTGTVVDSDGNLAGADVYYYQYTNGYGYSTTYTDSNGRFTYYTEENPSRIVAKAANKAERSYTIPLVIGEIVDAGTIVHGNEDLWICL